MSLPVPSTSSSSSSNVRGGGPGGTTVDPQLLQRLDAPLIALTQQCGGDLRRLLFAFFSFLHRRTDFYVIPPHSNDDDVHKTAATAASNMGFKEGDAEKLLLAAFRQFPLRRIPSQKKQQGLGGPSSMSSTAKTATKDTKETGESVPLTDRNQPEGPSKDSTATTATSTSTSTTTSNRDKATESITQPTSASTGSTTKNIDSNNKINNNMRDVEYNDENGLQIPVGNGGSTPYYKWTQTLDETTVLIGIPPSIRAKDLNVKISSTKLSVKTKLPLPHLEGAVPAAASSGGGSGSENEQSSTSTSSPHTFVDGELYGKVRPDESTWTVEGGVMIVTLDKFQKKFWSNVIVGHERIDTELVDSRRHISDYDDITQAQIRKTIFDQTQYHKGLPSSDELLQQQQHQQPNKGEGSTAGSSAATTATAAASAAAAMAAAGGTSSSPVIVVDTASSNPIPKLPAGVEYIDKQTIDEQSGGDNK